jgi:hypothetical protein
MWGVVVGVPQSQPSQFSRVLQQSAEMRMRAIQEKISITFTFCTTIELEIRFGSLNRAKDLLDKLDFALNDLTAHINNPSHVSDKTAKEKFWGQLAQLRQRVSFLNSQVEHRHSADRHNPQG